MTKIIKRSLFLLLLVILVVLTVFAWPRLPIITAFAAKDMCSCVFIADRDPASVESQDLSFFPISLAGTKIDHEEKSVTASLLGLAKRKAVYRPGLGCAVVVDFSEEDIRAQAPDTIPVAAYDPESCMWPAGELLPDTFLPGVDYPGLDTAVSRFFDAPGNEPFYKTQAVVVVYDGYLLFEKYAPGFDRTTELLGWSMAKTVLNALAGILVKDGLLDIDEPAGIKEWENDDRKIITPDNLMHMNAGLQWVENYFNLSEVTKMLYMSGDMYDYSIHRPLDDAVGSQWYYCSGYPNILSGLIRSRMQDDQAYKTLPYRKLFSRTGMSSAVLEADASGTFVASSYCFATPRDWARFGMLYLNDGVFGGDTILPPGWVDYSLTPTDSPDDCYAAMIWLRTPEEFPEGFDDLYFLDGFLGQRVFVVPSKKLVVVRMGYGNNNMNYFEFLKAITAALPG
jgi:CubicO group peptidase (beta-lactamase class C family)